jgi:hypothetical protein
MAHSFRCAHEIGRDRGVDPTTRDQQPIGEVERMLADDPSSRRDRRPITLNAEPNVDPMSDKR